jgi:hypothetical protein
MSKEKISKVLSIQLQHTVFTQKLEVSRLLQIVHVLLVKGWNEAALIALSIFFLSPFFTFGIFSFYEIYTIHLSYHDVIKLELP